jgi:Uma2 family endonuclease
MEADTLVEVLEPSVLRMPELSDDAFFDFCVSNEEYRIERTAEGRVIIMSGTGARTGARKNRLSAGLLDWSDRSGTGEAFDSSAIFRLPNSAMRAPNLSSNRPRQAIESKTFRPSWWNGWRTERNLDGSSKWTSNAFTSTHPLPMSGSLTR